jgi:hypothetical protein
MKTKNWFNLIAASVFFVTCPVFAMVYDHFDDGQFDPAWDVVFGNATGWTYTESGTNLEVWAIGATHPGVDEQNFVYLKQDFLAPDDFEVKCGLAWDSKGSNSVMQTLRVEVHSGDTVVARGDYHDGWLGTRGEKELVIGSDYYNSGLGTLPFAGSAEITVKRVKDLISIMWDNDVLLTGSSDLVIDKVALNFIGYSTTGASFGELSVDYITAVPEPATIAFLFVGSNYLLLKRKRR